MVCIYDYLYYVRYILMNGLGVKHSRRVVLKLDAWR